MGQLEQLTDPYVKTLVPVPPASIRRVCDLCHTRTGGDDYDICYKCNQQIRVLPHPPGLVVPISYAPEDGHLYYMLKEYKHGGAGAPTWQVRLAALLGRFLRDHKECILERTGDAWDVITTVPSTGGRPGAHPLEQVVRRIQWMESARLLDPGPGAGGMERDAAPDAFVARKGIENSRVLLVDDLFTSGARLYSASSALEAAGATVIAAVPIGRFIRPGQQSEYDPTFKNWWANISGGTFDFDTCCLESRGGRWNGLDTLSKGG